MLRRLPEWIGKLFSALVGVNVACASGSLDVPRDAPVEAREYLLTPARAPSAGETIDGEPQLVWRATVGRGVSSLPTVSSRVTIITSTDRWVYAIDTRSGATYWRRRGDGAYSTGAVVGGGRVFVASEGTGGRLTALRLTDGGRIWQTTVGDVSAPLALRDSVVYGVSDDGEAFAVGASRGTVLWQTLVGPSRAGALVTAHRIVVATLRDTLVVLDRVNGTVIGTFRLPAATAAPLALLDDTTAVMTSPAGSVHAVHIPTGSVRWNVSAGEPVRGSPAVHADTVFVLGGSCTLLRVPRHTPDVVRRDVLPSCVTVAAPLILRDGVLVATLSGDITFVSRATGLAVWTRRTGGAVRHPPLVTGRQIILATLGGEIFSLR